MEAYPLFHFTRTRLAELPKFGLPRASEHVRAGVHVGISVNYGCVGVVDSSGSRISPSAWSAIYLSSYVHIHNVHAQSAVCRPPEQL